MSRLNPVFSAITDIDDSIILGAKKPRKRPLVIAIAAAAALLTLVGFTVAKRFGVSVNGEDVFDYNLKVQSVTIPTVEEMEELGAVTQMNRFSTIWNTLPSNVFKSFDISPLINDKFSEEECDNNIHVFPSIEDPESIMMFYTLTNKTLDKEVWFDIFLMLKDDAGTTTNYIVNDSDNTNIETLTLNDGSSCIIVEWFSADVNCWKSTAEFSYDGIAYSLYIFGGTNEDMKQVLSDLGVL